MFTTKGDDDDDDDNSILGLGGESSDEEEFKNEAMSIRSGSTVSNHFEKVNGS